VLPWLLADVPVRGKARVTSRAWGTRALGSVGEPVDDFLCRPWTDRRVRFDVFGGMETLPLMVSRGCPYGRCTFCGEAGYGGQRVAQDLASLDHVLQAFPGAAIYFQDSIFPSSSAVRTALLPLLRDAGRPWGCQVFLPTLSRAFASLIAEHGCRYVYTGLESGSPALRACVGKSAFHDEVIFERLAWLSDAGVELGISLMFGVIDERGCLQETEATVEQTVELACKIVARGIQVVGFYPNVMTVLPGTRVDRGLRAAGHVLDFYRMPHVMEFEGLEDGGVGYNFASIPGMSGDANALVNAVREASRQLASKCRSPMEASPDHSELARPERSLRSPDGEPGVSRSSS
jgi:hypothetical protein